MSQPPIHQPPTSRPLISEGVLVEVTDGVYSGELGEVVRLHTFLVRVLIPRLGVEVWISPHSLEVRLGP